MCTKYNSLHPPCPLPSSVLLLLIDFNFDTSYSKNLSFLSTFSSLLCHSVYMKTEQAEALNTRAVIGCQNRLGVRNKWQCISTSETDMLSWRWWCIFNSFWSSESVRSFLKKLVLFWHVDWNISCALFWFFVLFLSIWNSVCFGPEMICWRNDE